MVGEEDGAARANRAATGTGNANRAVAGNRGQAVDDEPDEHLTWLVEDEMVWGNDASAPPAVLGVETAPAEAEQQ